MLHNTVNIESDCHSGQKLNNRFNEITKDKDKDSKLWILAICCVDNSEESPNETKLKTNQDLSTMLISRNI